VVKVSVRFIDKVGSESVVKVSVRFIDKLGVRVRFRDTI
jgi:hypothetical protein